MGIHLTNVKNMGNCKFKDLAPRRASTKKEKQAAVFKPAKIETPEFEPSPEEIRKIKAGWLKIVEIFS